MNLAAIYNTIGPAGCALVVVGCAGVYIAFRTYFYLALVWRNFQHGFLDLENTGESRCLRNNNSDNPLIAIVRDVVKTHSGHSQDIRAEVAYLFHRIGDRLDGSPTLLIIDEGWLLLEHEESARFVAGLVRRARKYYLGVSIISQQARDFLKSDYGRAIASQSALRILMRQDTTTIKGVVSEFNLSEYEQSFLLTCERGDALLIADQNHVAVKVVASDEEHPLITTNPAELYSA